ncbi:MAG: hypothetical protein KAU28_11245 [Phycisphaerae bacterium]|nr:hypothetical protein [Phycisphaerae bacterium]
MTIHLPIEIDAKRPLTPPETPYGQCGHCQHVSTEIRSKNYCPGCNKTRQSCGIWPEAELIELWHEEVAMWNDQRVELATVIAAMYFEASAFRLLYWGTVWLDPELNWIGAAFEEIKDKEKRIREFLYSIRSAKDTQAAFKKLFGVRGQEMLATTMGEKDASLFWNNYLQLADFRNQIVHKGRRAVYRALEKGRWTVVEKTFKEHLNWCLVFIPTCWVVFSRLHNEYIHKPMLARKKQEKT